MDLLCVFGHWSLVPGSGILDIADDLLDQGDRRGLASRASIVGRSDPVQVGTVSVPVPYYCPQSDNRKIYEDLIT